MPAHGPVVGLTDLSESDIHPYTPKVPHELVAKKTKEDRKGRAGHFWYFLICSMIKNECFAFFIKLITYICTNPI